MSFVRELRLYVSHAILGGKFLCWDFWRKSLLRVFRFSSVVVLFSELQLKGGSGVSQNHLGFSFDMHDL